MIEWKLCEILLTNSLGNSATPATLRSLALIYAKEASGEESYSAKQLSKKTKWSWNKIEKVGYLISRCAGENEIEDGIGNALRSLVSHFRSNQQKNRKKFHYNEKWKNAAWGHCPLCWRFVPSIKGTMLCSHHPSRSASYQRHKRKQSEANSAYIELHKTSIDNLSRHPPNEPKKWLEKYYPLTYQEILKKSGNPSDWISVITSLDDNTDPIGTRKLLHAEISSDLQQVISLLDWCESWSKVLPSRGGKRNGAGRKKQITP